MLHVVAARPQDAAPLRTLVAPLVPVADTDTVGDAMTALPSSFALALVADAGSMWRVFTALLAVRALDPWVPVLVVAPAARGGGGTAADRDGLVQAGADLVWTPDRLAAMPAEAVVRRLRRVPLQRLAEVARHAEHLRRPVRRAIVTGLIAERPPLTVRALGERIGLHRTTLWRHWTSAGSRALPPGEFLDLLLLVHAATHRQLAGTWREAAAGVGVLPSSLARVGRRVLPAGLSGTGAESRRIVCELFLDRVFGGVPIDWRRLRDARLGARTGPLPAIERQPFARPTRTGVEID